MFWNFKFLRRAPHNSPSGSVPIEETSLIGQIARTVTPLRTSGFIELDGKRYEVVSTRGFIPAQSLVKIIGRRMSWFTVEPAEDKE